MSAPVGVHGPGAGYAHRVAVLFGYNGASFNGLERNKGGRTIEGEILNAIATLTGQSDTTSKVTNVQIPTPDALNAILPETIRVFKIASPTEGFSARRTCDARTYEYLIPTYAFSTPLPQTGYAHNYQPDMSREELDALYPQSEGPTGKLFTTMKRGATLRRKNTAGRSGPSQTADFPSPPSSPAHVNEKMGADSKISVAPIDKNAAPNGNAFTRFFNTITRGRSRSKGNLQDEDSKPSITNVAVADDGKGSRSRSAPAHPRGNSGFYGSAGWDNGSSTNSDDNDDGEPRYYDPIDIPVPTEEGLSIKRRYRITSEQIDMLRHIVAIYRGTHNFHNYIPGASYDDERCYMRILSMELSEPEVHFGMEWIRVKVQAKAFARYQIRRMLAMMIMVVRTNTPRSIVANSFGFAQVDLPEAPAIGLICDEPFYLEYNANPNLAPHAKVDFAAEKGEVEKFRKSMIHDWVFKEEQEFMYFDAWLRSIDRFAFLYHFFLNHRGLIQPRRALLKPGASEAFAVPAVPPAAMA
ncbi:tRNA pseudouridine synthase 1 [Phlyctochytrium bullatum]|nr:tRNA pseudouridine synthase 1 [Phlyctochytrium bullatum]